MFRFILITKVKPGRMQHPNQTITSKEIERAQKVSFEKKNYNTKQNCPDSDGPTKEFYQTFIEDSYSILILLNHGHRRNTFRLFL